MAKILTRHSNRKILNTLVSCLHLNVPNFRKTAGIIIIGDEILKGQVLDTNSKFLTENLYKMGIKVERISVVPDNLPIVKNEIQTFSNQFTYVITTGGIGPTHDDITYEAAAQAFDEPLVENDELMQICRQFYNTKDMSFGCKLAHIPKSAKLTYGIDKATNKTTKFPNVSINNVYMFPGIPFFLRHLFKLIAPIQFGESATKFHYEEVYLNIPEVKIVANLNKIVSEFPGVTFGSYPELFNSYYKVKVTIESNSLEETKRAVERLKSDFNGHTISYDPFPLKNCSFKVKNIIDHELSHLRDSYSTLQEIVAQHHEIKMLFDGKNKSIVLLHLLYSMMVHKKHYNLHILYFHSPETTCFKEQTILDLCKRYQGTFIFVNNLKDTAIRDVLHDKYLLNVTNKLILGENVSCTVENPLERWTSDDCLSFIRHLSLPYCEMKESRHQTVSIFK